MLWLLGLAPLLFSFAILNQTVHVANCTLVSKCLAVIVLGYDQFVNASEKCYNLTSRWGQSEIMYLSSNLSITSRANRTADKANFSWALTSWLKNNSTPDTQVWIWIFSHGAGLHHHPSRYYGDEEWWSVDYPGYGRNETNSDEGLEITEYLIGKDVDGDGNKSNATWVGVDEGLYLNSAGEEEIVWDDEFKQWLNSTAYRRMVVFISTCRSPGMLENETASCYSGGFIDDLSAPRRIIISCTNETYYGWANKTSGIGWFEEPFMDALTPSTLAWNESKNRVDADGITSLLEAFLHAREHDMARMAVRNPSGYPDNDPWRNIYSNWREIDESPWLDDGGNFLPTFKNGADNGVGYYGYDTSDGELARCTWLIPEWYSGCNEDVNNDWKVDMTDIYIASSTYGSVYPQKWSSKASLADVNQDNKVDMIDTWLIAKKYGWTG